jgi:hypothetical protein
MTLTQDAIPCVEHLRRATHTVRSWKTRSYARLSDSSKRFGKKIKVWVYCKDSKAHDRLTSAREVGPRTPLLSLARRMPKNVILPLIMNKTGGEPAPPRGALRSQVTAIGTHSSLNGVVPPSCVNRNLCSEKMWMVMPLTRTRNVKIAACRSFSRRNSKVYYDDKLRGPYLYNCLGTAVREPFY